jgi:hypothetical protein
LIDVHECDRLPESAELQRIGRAAQETIHSQYGWERLVEQLKPIALSENGAGRRKVVGGRKP